MSHLDCAALHFIIRNSESDLQDDAAQELMDLLDHIKALKEQQARTDAVLADSVHGVKQTVAWNKRLDELQAENKRLVEEIKLLKYAAYDAAVEAAFPTNDD